MAKANGDFDTSWGRDGTADGWGAQETIGASLLLNLSLREKPKPTTEERLAMIAADYLGASLALAAGALFRGEEWLIEPTMARMRGGERPPPMRTKGVNPDNSLDPAGQVEFVLAILAKAVRQAPGRLPERVQVALAIAESVERATEAARG
jgi:hypothetical protein